MSKLAHFPLMAIVVVIYNIAAIGMGANLEAPVIQAMMPSGSLFAMTFGQLLVALGLLLLYGEILKATRTGSSSITDHALSMAIFVIALIQFLVLRRAGTAVYFLILLMTLLDVVAGFTVTIKAARRDWG